MNHLEALRLFEPVGRIEKFVFENKQTGQSEPRLRSVVDVLDERPGVYAWVEQCSSGHVRLIYIGKAEKNISARQAEHTNGFANSDRGRAHAVALRDLLDNKKSSVAVHAFYPEDGRTVAQAERWLLDSVIPKPIRNAGAPRY